MSVLVFFTLDQRFFLLFILDMVNSPKRLPTSETVPTHQAGMKTSGAVPSSVAPWQDAPPVPFLLEENAAAAPDEMASQCPQQ